MTARIFPRPAAEDPLTELDPLLDAHLDEFIAFRRRLHMHPELSGQERATTESIVSRLQVSDLVPLVLPSGTGAVCDVPGRAAGPIIALRADIDALAMDEAPTTRYRSRVPGVAHCCGHDMHTTMVLAAGLILSRLLRRPGAPAGSVRLIFEPAEESVPGGAVEVIHAGHLDSVSMIFALHCDPKADVGVVRVTEGAITSASDIMEIHLSGPGGHTARPEMTVDLVKVAAHIAIEAPRLMDHNSLRPGATRLAFGSLRAGHAHNVLPSHASLYGTLRAQHREDWDTAPDVFDAAIRRIVEPTGAEWEIDYHRGIPPVVNDPGATRLVAEVAEQLVGPENVTHAGQSWGGDSFAWYLEHVPGSYARLGVHDPTSRGPRRDLHASDFAVDEDAIAVGVRLLVTTAWRALEAAG